MMTPFAAAGQRHMPKRRSWAVSGAGDTLDERDVEGGHMDLDLLGRPMVTAADLDRMARE